MRLTFVFLSEVFQKAYKQSDVSIQGKAVLCLSSALFDPTQLLLRFEHSLEVLFISFFLCVPEHIVAVFFQQMIHILRLF